MIKRKIKLNFDLAIDKPIGTVIDVDCDKWGMPLDHFWRQRVLDSEYDSCVEFVEDKAVKKEQGNKKEKKRSVEEIDPEGDK